MPDIKPIHALTPTPPMGWNSFDCYGCAASEKTLMPNLELMAKRLKPCGYEYFVVDNGWFAEYQIEEGREFPREKHAQDTRIDEYGRYLPSHCYFPNGLRPLIDTTHAHGLKFGIHLMRGISRKAVHENTPILGTTYRAQDIANVEDKCSWCHYNYGVDMDNPGAQPFYDSVVAQLAEWGVDFIKADDITGFPREVEALALAIRRSGRDMALSLSPGGQTTMERMEAYQRANMLRTTRDIWDNRKDLNQAFEAWEKYNDVRVPGFWLDMDMIPFGHLQLWNPRSNRGTAAEDANGELSGKGFQRMSGLTREQKYTFITMRALAASPLFMGGDLPTSDEFSFELITNREMLACNQNGVMGTLAYRDFGIDVWTAPRKGRKDAGWVGIFNRTVEPCEVRIALSQIGVSGGASPAPQLENIWTERSFAVSGDILKSKLPADGVLFLRYGEH